MINLPLQCAFTLQALQVLAPVADAWNVDQGHGAWLTAELAGKGTRKPHRVPERQHLDCSKRSRERIKERPFMLNVNKFYENYIEGVTIPNDLNKRVNGLLKCVQET